MYAHERFAQPKRQLKLHHAMLLNQLLNPKLNHYSEAIAEITGAPRMVLPIIERIMRDVIFHSTLDWQTEEQFRAGALEAYQVYQSAEGFYDAEHKAYFYRFHFHKTEEKLAAAVAKLDRATAKGAAERIARCQAEVEKIREKRDRLAQRVEWWEASTRKFAELFD